MDRHQNSFKEEIHIDEILLEAKAFGLNYEVDLYAKKILEENPKMNKVKAYQLAYQEWIK
jgi:hypothetical protein